MDSQSVQQSNSNVQKSEGKVGRPQVIDPAVEQLLVGAFQNGLSVTKACEYAQIARRTYYYYCQNEPEFLRKMTAAQNHQVLLAGNAITEILENPADRDRGKMSRWIYEKKMPEEYGNKTIPIGGGNGTQNNFFLLNNEQLGDITKQSGIDESDPTELLEAVETASNVDIRTEEESTPSLY